MERDSQGMTGQEFESGVVFPEDLLFTKERRAYLAIRLTELLRELQKLEALDSLEIEPAMTPFSAGSR